MLCRDVAAALYHLVGADLVLACVHKREDDWQDVGLHSLYGPTWNRVHHCRSYPLD